MEWSRMWLEIGATSLWNRYFPPCCLHTPLAPRSRLPLPLAASLPLLALLALLVAVSPLPLASSAPLAIASARRPQRVPRASRLP